MDINLLMEDEELMALICTAEKWQRLVDALPDRQDLKHVRIASVKLHKAKCEVSVKLNEMQ